MRYCVNYESKHCLSGKSTTTYLVRRQWILWHRHNRAAH